MRPTRHKFPSTTFHPVDNPTEAHHDYGSHVIIESLDPEQSGWTTRYVGEATIDIPVEAP